MNSNMLAIDTALPGCNAGVQAGGQAGRGAVSQSVRQAEGQAGRGAVRQAGGQAGSQAEGALHVKCEAMARGQAELLVPMVQDVMSAAGLAFGDLDAVVTTIGPGAFTGLRIGLSTARSFGLALDVPVIGLTTLEVIAHQYEAAGSCAVILETKRDDYYAQIFDADKAPLSEALALPGEALEALLTEYPDAALIGDAVERFSGKASDIVSIDPAVMLKLGQERLTAGEVTAPEPLYLRGADVSERKTPLRVLEANSLAS